MTWDDWDDWDDWEDAPSSEVSKGQTGSAQTGPDAGPQEPPPSLGTCCACGGTEGVRNVLMLAKRAPIPGRGWSCLVCGLPADGAVSVLCDACLDPEVSKGGAPLKYACRGYPAHDGRVPIEALIEPFEHDRAHSCARTGHPEGDFWPEGEDGDA